MEGLSMAMTDVMAASTEEGGGIAVMTGDGIGIATIVGIAIAGITTVTIADTMTGAIIGASPGKKGENVGKEVGKHALHFYLLLHITHTKNPSVPCRWG